MTHDGDPDSLFDFGIYDPRAIAFPARKGFRGPAPEDRDCAGPGARAAYLDRRRACPGAGRLRSGAGPEPVPEYSAGVGHYLPVRIPRPEQGFEHLGPRGSDACWPHRRGGRDRSDLSCAPASRCVGFAGSGFDAGASCAKDVRRGLAGTTVKFREPAAWLRVFRPPRAFDRRVPARDPVIPTRRGRPLDRLSPKRRNRLGGHSGAWPGCMPESSNKTK